MTALFSHKKLFISVFALLLAIAGGIFLLSQKRNIFRSTNIAAAALEISPVQEELMVGQEATFSIEVDTNGQAVNTVTVNLSYPAEILELTNLNLQDSFAKIWFEKEVSVPGIIKLTGSLPTPGFTGQGTLAKLTFRAKTKGEAKISFSSDCAVFRNLDSLNILGHTESGIVQVR